MSQPDAPAAGPSGDAAGQHPFVSRPHRTLLALSLPVLISLIAEPLTGMVDTAFVARLGVDSTAALGAAIAAISFLLWVFNFLGIGTQTEVAAALGRGDPARAAEAAGVASRLAFVLGLALLALGWPLADSAAAWMGTSGETSAGAASYIRIRLLGASAVLVMMAAFGALRGLQDMRTPLWIALATNALNVILDALLIFGLGPFPELGLDGAAWASTASQWCGAALSLLALRSRLGLRFSLSFAGAGTLLVVGRDLVIRSASLLLFTVLATRVANTIGPESGAAHHAVRQSWMLTAFLLDAYASAAQSLVGFFLASNRPALARRVAAVSTAWSLGTGAAITALMIAGTSLISRLLVPQAAAGLFALPWLIAAASQPLNALSFVTDGIHWGTGDYRYLRNAMLISTAVAAAALLTIDSGAENALAGVWIVFGVWIAVRAGFGLLRIWPGIGRAPLGRRAANEP